MTTIVGYKGKGYVALVADCRLTCGDTILTDRKEKITSYDWGSIAMSGTTRHNQKILTALDSITEFNIEQIIVAIEKEFPKTDGKRDLDITINIITKDLRMFQIFNDLAYVEFFHNQYITSGSGSDFAEGALEYMKISKTSTINLTDMKKAIECASRRDPFTSLNTTVICYGE